MYDRSAPMTNPKYRTGWFDGLYGHRDLPEHSIFINLEPDSMTSDPMYQAGHNDASRATGRRPIW